MENQHRKITGYRELSFGEVELMNKIKAAGLTIDQLGQEVSAHLGEQSADAVVALNTVEEDRIAKAEPLRWLRIAKTDFQTALMALTRAVAQPTSF